MKGARYRIMKNYEKVNHSFEPIFDRESRVLILGTFPSVKSREQQFYYGHPQNRFWKLLALLTDSSVPRAIDEKKDMLLRSHIAIWDVVESCEIIGSSDSSIRNVVPADLNRILKSAPIQAIYANGTKAYELYQKYAQPMTGRQAEKLPSTSPANAAWQLERLVEAWRVILKEIH